jgi:uncharacterized protein (DUF1330 family)
MIFQNDEDTINQQIPPECTQYIFTYLELVDCLRLASTSSVSLRGILPTIRQRRDRMMKTYAVVVTKKKIHSSTAKYIAQIGDVEELQNTHANNDYMYEFPTLQQRVAFLEVKIPCEHPMYKLVCQLKASLCNCTTDCTDSDKSTQSHKLIDQLTKLVLPLKLHATILKNTVLSKQCYEQSASSTTLQNYIGDVLCVTYLFYDFGRDYAEGSISPQWLDDKLHLYAPTCYQSWVLMHSSILRTKPFAKDLRIRLGLSSGFEYIDSINTSFCPENLMYSSSKLFGWNVSMLQLRTDQFVKSEICVVYDDFGPLGPSFRGRDIVRVRDVSADSITECLLYYNSLSTSQGVNTANNSIREALEWICVAHQQAFLRRPMSVRLPIVRFSC